MNWALFNNELKTNQTLFQNFPEKADQKNVWSWLLLRLWREHSLKIKLKILGLGILKITKLLFVFFMNKYFRLLS